MDGRIEAGSGTMLLLLLLLYFCCGSCSCRCSLLWPNATDPRFGLWGNPALPAPSCSIERTAAVAAEAAAAASATAVLHKLTHIKTVLAARKCLCGETCLGTDLSHSHPYAMYAAL